MFKRLRRLSRFAGKNAVMLWYACQHPSTSPLVKIGAVLLALYVISPIDLIPDTLPIIGWMDDATMLTLGIAGLLKLVPGNALSAAEDAAERRLSKWKIFSRR